MTPRIEGIFIACVLLLAACKGGKQSNLPLPSAHGTEDSDMASVAHKWYAFVDGDVRAVALPRRASPVGRKPWTESVRVSAMCAVEGNGIDTPAAYALVNRLGMIEINGDKIRLHQDASVFNSRTAAQMAFSGDVPIFCVYRNTIFNELAFPNATSNNMTNKEAIHQFLVQFDPNTHIFYPIISCGNLSLDDNAQVVGYVWDGNKFLCSVKTMSIENNTLGRAAGDAMRTRFSYLSLAMTKPLLSLTPATAAGALTITPSNKEEYRAAAMTQPFAASPPRLRALLRFLEQQVSFIITCYTVGGHTPRGYTNEVGGALLNAYATLGDTYAAALFSDGTMYLSGAVSGAKTTSTTVAFRLPCLPDGWAYTSFAISGSHLYAAWEETDFYQSGRSGLIAVDLSKVL